jgi:hypothetical protein
MSRVRCAIYTRKSTDEGLELEFNSLEAQYDACAAYFRAAGDPGATHTSSSAGPCTIETSLQAADELSPKLRQEGLLDLRRHGSLRATCGSPSRGTLRPLRRGTQVRNSSHGHASSASGFSPERAMLVIFRGDEWPFYTRAARITPGGRIQQSFYTRWKLQFRKIPTTKLFVFKGL